MHAVSEGVESVVEDREVESDHESKAHVQFLLFLCNQYQLFPCSLFSAIYLVRISWWKITTSPLLLAVQRQKELLVKYKGLAHVHNRWIPEEKIKVENPELLAKYSLAKYKRYQV